MLAAYVHKFDDDLEVRAMQLASGGALHESLMAHAGAEAGDWFVEYPDGEELIIPDYDFKGEFQQKYPRLAGERTVEPPTPHRAA